jgi:serine/threonine protein kinase/Tfp pilus assembly protein PilF
MKPERFARLKQIFLEARALPEAERPAYLERACADDADLLRDAQSLMAHPDEVPHILESGAIEDFLKHGVGGYAPDRNRAIPGRIADYEIKGVLGEGGMGIVYEAQQEDPKRLVALKVIRSGPFIDEQHIKMFRREEIALAKLKHPGIAAIYEAGRTDEGQHFFAMELVRGVPLDEYLGKVETGDVDFRLRLFLKICSAISYAHQSGIIHRDLKPSNILIQTPAGNGDEVKPRSEPDAKVLDFGLAKITDADVTMVSVATVEGRVQGTLAYMSPEQARGDTEAVDLRTDVYALGVILYEMLTGERPYSLHPVLIPQAVRTICDEDPTRPSSHSRTLRGDLEVIILKALEKEPTRRYQSVAALADDIERYLSGQPILARPPSAMYHLRKLVARHKAPFAAAAVIFLLAIAFGITMLFMFQAQRRERDRAETEARKAKRISEFMWGVFMSPDPWGGKRDITVREVLDKEAAKVEEEFADDPELRAGLLTTIGNCYKSLGLYEEAVRYLEAALKSRQERFGGHHPRIALGLNILGHALIEKGDLAKAESTFVRALQMGRQVLDEDDPLTADIAGNLAQVTGRQGRWEEAVSLYREVIAMRKRVLPEDHPDVARSLNNLAATLYQLDRHAEAEPLYREALSVYTGIHGERHPDVASITDNLARVLGNLGKVEEAESLHLRALGVRKDVLGEGHPYVAISYNNLGTNLAIQDRLDEAEIAYRRSVSVCLGAYGDVHPRMGLAMANLALTMHQAGKYDSAEVWYRSAIDIQEEILDTEHPHLNATREGLATLMIDTGCEHEAEPILLAVADALKQSLADDHWRHATVRCRLGWCYAAQGREDEAKVVLSETRTAVLAIPNARARADMINRCARLYESWGMPEEAAAYRTAEKPGT